MTMCKMPFWPKCQVSLHASLVRQIQSSHPGRDNALPLLAVALRDPAWPAVGLTSQSDSGAGRFRFQDLQARPPLGHKGTGTHAGAAGKSGCGGAPEGQLTVLSHSGLQVRKQFMERISTYTVYCILTAEVQVE